MNLIQLLSNSTKMQIMQFLLERGTATTKQISERLKDIPLPTLYRHINEMIKGGFLLVKEENRVRGSIERVLALNSEVFLGPENGDLAKTAFQFLMGLYVQFQRYSEKPDIDPAGDLLMLRTCMLNLTDEKYMALLRDWAQLFEKYRAEEGNGKLRSISTISAPVE